MKTVRLAVMQKVKFPDPYIKVGGNKVRIFVFLCVPRGVVSLVLNYRRIEINQLTLSDPTSKLVRQYDFPVPPRCRKTSDTVFVAFVRPLSETARAFPHVVRTLANR
jgi:hypothetical protein